MKGCKKLLCLLLSAVMVISGLSVGLLAAAEGGAYDLQAIAAEIKNAPRDNSVDGVSYYRILDLIAGLSADQLIEVGRRGGAATGEEFWWAGHRALTRNYFYRSGANAAGVRVYSPSLFLEIAERVPAYADFVQLLFDGVTAYAFLIGTPTAQEIALSPEERTPFAIGKRIAALPYEQANSLTSATYFGVEPALALDGITENLDESKAKDESIGAIRTVTERYGVQYESWESVYKNSRVMINFYLAARYFKLYYYEAENNRKSLQTFVQTVNALKAPYRTADVAAAQAAYRAVSATAWSMKDDAVLAALEKYNEIITANALENNPVDLSGYRQTDLGKKQLCQTTADLLKRFFTETTDTNQKLQSWLEKQATGERLVALLGWLGNVHKYAANIFSIGVIANSLRKDPKFSAAVQKMEDLIAQGHTTTFNEYGPDKKGFKKKLWSSSTYFTSEDFGFSDGDFYGFIDAFGACLSDTETLFALVGSFKNKIENGGVIPGHYEEIFPVFEMLDIQMPSSDAFTKAEEAAVYYDAAGNAYQDNVRAAVNAGLAPIAEYYYGTVRDDPLSALLDLLPKIVYVLESGMLNDVIQKLLSNLKDFGLEIDFTLSSKEVWEFIDRRYVTGYLQKSMDGKKTRWKLHCPDIDGDKKADPIPLTHEQFSELLFNLCGAAKATVKKSVSIQNENRFGLDAQHDLVLSSLLLELLNILKTDNGKTYADKLLTSKNANRLVRGLVKLAEEKSRTHIFSYINTFMPFIFITAKMLRLIERTGDRLKSLVPFGH